MTTYRAVSGAALAALEERNAAPVRAIPAPFSLWADNCMGRGGQVGLAHGWHILAAGRSGHGKTYLAANLAAHAIANAEAVTFHSLEMDWDELAVRILSIVSDEPAWKLNPGRHFSRERFRAARRAIEANRGELHINDEPMFKLADLLGGIRRNFEEHGSRLHIVDYLQLAWTGEIESQVARITEVSHAVRQLAKELRITTFCLSQFNRETSKNRTERPAIEGMIGGSSLENDADQVLLIDHSRRAFFRDQITNRIEGWDGWLNLEKNRHGPSVDIPIRFVAESGRIRQRDDDEIKEGEVAK